MIKVLDQDTANKIAAGEVVERPASVVKELVENSLDAGATEITVEVLGGGISFLRVRDNGNGIDKEELPLALKRHATSKIASADDLIKIATLGFRGEALPSIAAVSRFKLASATEGKTGSQIEVLGGEVLGATPKAMARGTIVEIEDLFYNVPARRKFLRTENTESGRIQRYLEAVAIAREDVAFTYLNNGKKTLETQGTDTRLLAIKEVYGSQLADELLQVNYQLGQYSINGYVGKPDIARGRRDLQIFIINQRLVECKTVLAALEKAFYDIIPKGRYPVAFLDLSVPPNEVDVNVHPAKMVVRLSSDSQVFSLVYKAIKEAVDTRLLEPGSFSNPYGRKQLQQPFESKSFTIPNDAEWVVNRQRPQESDTPFSTPKELSWLPEPGETLTIIKDTTVEYNTNTLYPKILGQANLTYIIAEWEDCLIMYDQHSAHERILYEKYLLSLHKLPQTELLFPLPLTLDPEEFAALERLKEELEKLGFTLVDFGPASLAITHVPVDVQGTEAEATIKELLLEKPNPQFREKAAAILACKGAVKAGVKLAEKQMHTLIRDLLKCKTPALCPHGRPTMLRLDWNEMEKRFGRGR